MANVIFKKGLRANLPSTYTEGTFYITTDESAAYLDISDSARIRLGDVQEFATLEALTANTNPSTTALYYVKDINCLAKWDGSQYIQINRDTGMTSVEVSGDGNAVTAAVYDATGRKLTLTKGATYMTADDVDSKISAKVGDLGNDASGAAYETVKAYVDAKTDGIASDEALTALTTRVTTAEGDIDALQEAVGNGGSIDTRITNAIGALDVTDTPVSGQYVSGVSEDNGMITVTRAPLPDYSETYDAKGAADTALADAKTYADGKDTAIAAAKSAADAAQADVDALEATVGTVTEGKTVVQMIADAQTAATYDDTALAARVTATEASITTLNGDATTEGSVAKQVSDAVAKIVADAPEAYDTLKEISDWISSHADDASAMNSQITTNKNDIAALKTLVGTLPDTATATTVIGYIDEAVAGLSIGDYAKAADLTAAITRIAALEADTHTHDNKTVLDGITAAKVTAWDAAESNAKTYAKEYADGLAGNYDASGAADTAETNAKSYADQKIAALDKADTAVSGQYVSAVSEEDGVITVTRATLPDYSETYDPKGAADTALTEAKAYADSLVMTWGSF